MLWLPVAVALLTVPPLAGAVQLCPSPAFRLWKGTCYSFHEADWTDDWNVARDDCKSMASDLVVMTTPQQNAYVGDVMTGAGRSRFWIGYKKTQGENGGFEWVDGQPHDFERWAPGEPNDHQGREDCVEVTGTAHEWNDQSCDLGSNGYVCQAAPTDGWKTYDGHEYYVDAGATNPNWFEARAFCNEHGGELTSILSVAEGAKIAEWMQLMKFKAAVWIGLHKLDGDQTRWTWSDLSSETGYTNWKYGRPGSDTKYRALCGATRSDDSAVEWFDDHCDDAEHGFVCKRLEGDTSEKTPRPPVTGGGFCPNAMTAAGDKCFSVHYRDVHNGHDWQGAVDFCRQRAGHLGDIASVSTPLQQAVVTSMLQRRALPLWIGLYRREPGTREWLWSDNSAYDFTKWGPGEPLSQKALCADVRPYGFIGTWGTRDCAASQGFICQVRKDPAAWISTPGPTPGSCGAGFVAHGASCYKLHTEVAAWDVAQAACVSEQAALVSVHGGAQNGFVQTLALQSRSPVWLGLRDVNRLGVYTWADGWAVTYTRWGAGEPSLEPDVGGCVVLRQMDGTWEDTTCTRQMAFVCETTDAPPITTPAHQDGKCPSRDGWQQDGRFCYKFEPNARKSWGGALLACKTASVLASLVSLHSVHENAWVHRQLLKVTANLGDIWVGLYRRTDTRGFAWSDLTPLQFEHWGPGEPDGPDGACASFSANYPAYWAAAPCTTYNGYICKVPKVVVPTLPPAENGTCPGGWQAAGSHCYLFRPNVHLRWVDARLYCREQGDALRHTADLVVIRNEAQDVFVNAEMFLREDSPDKNKQFWVGLAKKKAGAPYMWVDGTPVDAYDHWETGEPSSAFKGDNNCVMQYVDSTRWADTDCGLYKGFVCTISKVVVDRPGGAPGMSGGAVAGIVIGTLAGLALLALLLFVVVFRNKLNPVDKARQFASGFSNPFYSESKMEAPSERP